MTYEISQKDWTELVPSRLVMSPWLKKPEYKGRIKSPISLFALSNISHNQAHKHGLMTTCSNSFGNQKLTSK